MIFLMVSLLFIGAFVGALFGIRVLIWIIIFWLLLILLLWWFVSTSAFISWIVAAVIFECGYFLGMIVRAILDAAGFKAFGLIRDRRSD